MRRALALALLLFPGSAPARPAAAPAALELRGTVDLLQDGKKQAQGVDEAVVFFTPAARPRLQPPAAPLVMVTQKKEFKPRLLVVPAGARVSFPNQDPILHNVFSVSPGNAFDLGLLGKGPGKDVQLKTPGLVRVFCNVHQSMAAYVLVVDTPYSGAPDARGNFVLAGLPAGPGTLSVWHERGEVVSLPVTLPASGPVRLSLPVSKRRVPTHLNKFGKPYRTDGAY